VINPTCARDELTRVAHDGVYPSSPQQLSDEQKLRVQVLLSRHLVHDSDYPKRRGAALCSPLIVKDIEERAFCNDPNWCCRETLLLVTAELLKAP
jgi:hypothetical protein